MDGELIELNDGLYVVHREEKISGSHLMPVLVQAWHELLEHDMAPHEILLYWEQNAVYVVCEDNKRVVAIVSYYVQEHCRSLYMVLGWTNPQYRGIGMFRILFKEIQAIAREKDCRTIEFGTNIKNKGMRKIAEHMGFQAEAIDYSMALPPKRPFSFSYGEDDGC